jgi:hypothetical protein
MSDPQLDNGDVLGIASVESALFEPAAFHNNTKARPKVAGETMVNISKIIVISNIVVSAIIASVQCIFQERFSIHRCQCGTGKSRRIEEDANCDQNCNRSGFGGRLNVLTHLPVMHRATHLGARSPRSERVEECEPVAPVATTLFRWLGQPRLLHAIGEDRDRDRGDEEAHGN